MFCPNCGNELENRNDICKNCDKKNEIKIKSSIGEERIENYLIDCYIGKNENEIRKTTFSIPTFFFGAEYFLYRKMWLYAIIWFVSPIIILFFLPSLTILIELIIYLYFSLNFRKIYLKHVEKKVEKIKSKNPNMSSQELAEICKKQGGTCIFAMFLPAIIYVVMILIMIIYVEIETSDNNSKPSIQSDEFGNLIYEIPSEFDSASYTDDKNRHYSFYEAEESCSVHFSKNDLSVDTSAEDYLKEQISLDAPENDIKIEYKTINNYDWIYVNTKSEYREEHHYAIEKDNLIYTIEFAINDDGGKCSKAHSLIIDSLEIQNNTY